VERLSRSGGSPGQQKCFADQNTGLRSEALLDPPTPKYAMPLNLPTSPTAFTVWFLRLRDVIILHLCLSIGVSARKTTGVHLI